MHTIEVQLLKGIRSFSLILEGMVGCFGNCCRSSGAPRYLNIIIEDLNINWIFIYLILPLLKLQEEHIVIQKDHMGRLDQNFTEKNDIDLTKYTTYINPSMFTPTTKN